MIRKLLVANRGEIALRIIRACKEMGIRSVAIYSDADRFALHVKKADEAYNIGPESIAAYLNVHRIVNLARATKCDALHPGYGFLSENPELAKECQQQGIVFVGPDADVIAAMGDKLQARASMIAANIPVVPGSDGNVQNLEEALVIADEIGYPVMLKATAGGGGRGIRRCDDAKQLTSNFDRVRSEAEKAFASTDIFIEKYVIAPRHIEVQILADQQGNVVHLFERDCSIQRRHQKLIEIAPSPQLTAKQRKQVCDLAVQVAQVVNYHNAGTVEFLFDQSGEFYFLEMNTRLQVEHPITEQITGIDIVQQQILIACGETLKLKQNSIRMRGFAIEFRINAEDPKNDFLPSFGHISKYYAPGGPGVRTDSAIYTGYNIPPDFDSLCAKLTVWALDWPSVLERAKRALDEMRLRGIKTTIPYYLQLLEDKDFCKKKFDTSFIETHPQLLNYSDRLLLQHRAVVIAAALAVHLGAS